MQTNMILLLLILSLTALINGEDVIGRIIGGDSTEEGEFPFLVSIEINGHHMCSGSIIKENWIVTSAHCIYSDNFTLYEVVAGTLSLINPSETTQRQKAKQCIKHSEYNSTTKAYNIALIELEEPLTIEEGIVEIIELHNGNEGTDFLIAGWGSTSTSLFPMYPEVLQKANVTLIETYQCKSLLVDYLGTSELSSDSACSIPSTALNEGFCLEDLGGPMIYTYKKVNYLYGVMSWHLEPCGQDGAPSVYAKISDSKEFITNTITAITTTTTITTPTTITTTITSPTTITTTTN